MKPLEVKIKPGKVRLSSLTLLNKSRDLIYLGLDCNTKYYTISISESSDSWTITLDGDEETLRMSRRTNPTELTIAKLDRDDKWELVCPSERARYATRLYLIRERAQMESHWIQNSRPSVLKF